MAGEIQIDYGITGQTLYAVVTNGNDQFYNANTPGFEAYNAANWTSTKYCIALIEDGSSGHYKATFPVVAAGVYNVGLRAQAGGSPAITDANIGSGQMQWNGTVEMGAATLLTQTLPDLANDTAARATFAGMLRALFNRFYNQVTQTSTQQIVKNDSGTSVSTMTTSDDGTTAVKNMSS